MYLLYPDDSGSVNNANEDYFVLGGVCLIENGVRWLSWELEKYAQEINPDDPSHVEFHASEIFGGRSSIWRKYSKKEDRIEIMKKVLQIMDDSYSAITFATAVHKASYPGKDPVLMAFEDISSRFDMFLSRKSTEENKQYGLIVLDESSYETSLQNLVSDFRRDGNRWGRNLRQIIETPLFADSKATRILQLADHIAYAVFRRYNASDLNYFNCIEGKFDSVDGIIHGLAHMQTYNRDCTCPSCMSKRYPQPPQQAKLIKGP